MKGSQVFSANKWIEKDRHVWVKALPQYPNPNEDAFLQAKVVQIYDKQILIDLIESQAKIKAPIANVLKLTYGVNDVADMVDLQQLNEPELLFNIKRRYINDLVFTYCGPTLVIINPYAFIQKLFNDSLLQQYQTMVFTDNLQYKSLPPHVFALAAFSLWQLFDNQRNQSIVISGQSGAGKTQNTKYCLKFLASLGKNMKQLVSDPSQKSLESKNKRINYQNMKTAEKAIKKGSKVFGIQQKILGCNQVLQAFGNSKTIRNDNSSRFGKLILLVYGQTQIDIKSAFIISYLLQKSRIVSVSDGERNYHIFYYFCKGTTPEEKVKYKLKDPINKYFYLNQSTVYDLPKAPDEQKFLQIKKEFELYFKLEEIQCVYKILSIVLNIGNLLFKKGQNKNNQQIVTIINEQYIKNVTQLLQVKYQDFKYCFQFRTRKMGANVISSPLKYDEALSLRDSFAKNIYQKIFNFLVSKLNQKIEIQKIDFDSATSRDSRKSIGLLDIFGFQVLLINSLEQFFINFANQKLQQLYVSYIFKEQKNQFLKEGLQQFSHDIGFQDNKPIIDLFELYPLGIFHLINQSSQLNKPDENLPQSIIKNHKYPFITIPKSKKNHFQIDHSCSSVSYNTMGFTAKNKDQFPRQLLEVIKTTQNPFLKMIVVGEQKQEQTKTKKASSKFLGSKFLSQMNKLIDQLYSCDCHFVRCIKPNSKKAPKLFNSQSVLQSLRYLGVLDSIKIRKLGYIYRRPYKQFFKKFYELQRYIFSYNFQIQGKTQQDFKEQCRRILQKYAKQQLDNKDILFGSKKILIKQSALNHLELLTKQKRRQRIKTAERVKLMYKNAVFRVKVKQCFLRNALLKAFMQKIVKKARQAILIKKVSRIQRSIRKKLWQMRWEKIKEVATKSVTKISSYIKMKKQRKIYLHRRQNIIKLQSNIKTYLKMKLFQKQRLCFSIMSSILNNTWQIIERKMALLIQKVWKGYIIRKRFKQVLKRMKVRAFFKRTILKFRIIGFRQILKLYKKPILKLQSIVKARYLRRTFLKVKKSVIIIQKAFRRHLHKKFYLQKAWQKYISNIFINQKNKKNELMVLGYGFKGGEDQKINVSETLGCIQKLTSQQISKRFSNSPVQQNADMIINESITFADKNTIQVYLADIDIISTLNYKGKWTSKYANLKYQLKKKQQYPIKIDVGETTTCVTSNKDRIYCFGIEGDTQFCKAQIKSYVHIIYLNNQSVYVLNKQSELYSWGDCKNGDLYSSIRQNSIKQNSQININNIKDISLKDSNKYYVDEEGKVYFQNQNQDKLSLIKFNQKVFIQTVVMSYNFAHFLSTTGYLYSIGSNKYGQLGIGKNIKFTNQPVLNEFLISKKQIIQTVSAGLNHTVVRTKLNYVYAWGDNRSGQVSIQTNSVYFMPFQIQIQKSKFKVLQIVAGLRSTYLLTQNFVILGLGASIGFDTTKTISYHQLDLLNSTNSNPKFLIPLKLSCSWNRQMSILSVNCLQQNKCKIGTKPDVVYKYCKLIAKDWVQKRVYPQYSEWMDNILNIGDMRKFKFQKMPKNKVAQQNGKKSNQSEIDQLKVLMDLRKTSALFKNAARSKIQQILKRLGSKPNNQWSNDDHELNTYIKQNCKVLIG